MRASGGSTSYTAMESRHVRLSARGPTHEDHRMGSLSKMLFGEIALRKGLVTQQQIDECLEIQKKLKEMGFGRCDPVS